MAVVCGVGGVAACKAAEAVATCGAVGAATAGVPAMTGGAGEWLPAGQRFWVPPTGQLGQRRQTTNFQKPIEGIP